MALEYRKVFYGGEAGFRWMYAVIWAGTFIGYAAHWRSSWLVGLNDGLGTWETVPTGLPIACRRREDVALRLAAIHEGLLKPGDL